MTREEIMLIAEEAGVRLASYSDTVDERNVYPHELERFAKLIREHEREACAAVCCDMIDAEYKTGKVDHNEMAWTQACANAIRART